MKLEKLKRGTCVLLAATLMGTVFTGCSKNNSLSENTESESTSCVSEEIKEINDYDYTTYIKDAIIIKYQDLYDKDKYIAVYPKHIICNLAPDDYNLYTLDKRELLYEDKYDIFSEDGGLGNLCYKLGNKLGNYVGHYYLSKFLLAEYGLKKLYTKEEIDGLINKLNNGEIVFDGENISVPEETTTELVTEVEKQEEIESDNTNVTKPEEELKIKLNNNGKKLYLLHTNIYGETDENEENSFCYIVYNENYSDDYNDVQMIDYKTGKRSFFESRTGLKQKFYHYIDVSSLLGDKKDSVTEDELNEILKKCSFSFETKDDELIYCVNYNGKKYKMTSCYSFGPFIPYEVNISYDTDISEAVRISDEWREKTKKENAKYEDANKVSITKSMNKK